jgi:hypothetical protein
MHLSSLYNSSRYGTVKNLLAVPVDLLVTVASCTYLFIHTKEVYFKQIVFKYVQYIISYYGFVQEDFCASKMYTERNRLRVVSQQLLSCG